MKKNKLYLIFALISIIYNGNSSSVSRNELSFKYKAVLDHENLVRLDWSTEKVKTDNLIVFKLTVILNESPSVIGFGFSDRGQFQNADLVLINVINNELDHLIDAHTDENGVLIKDSKQDYSLIKFKITQTNEDPLFKLTVIFERKLDTCDIEDYKIESGTVHMIHFIHTLYRDVHFLSGHYRPESDSTKSDMKQVQLIKSTYFENTVSSFNPNTAKYFDILNSQVRISDQDTTYWCKVFKLNPRFNRKHHIIGFESVISEESEGVVHHMELFHCVTEPDEEGARTYDAACNSEEKPKGLKQCRKVVAAWAMGAGVFIYPENVGGVIGGENYSPYLVLEIHYDNPKRRNDIVDSSGMRIYYQGGLDEPLRQYDAGILEVGLEYNSKNSIPPKTDNFHLHGFCLTECTKASLPEPNGIFIFASQLHTHLTGRRVWTSLIRDGELADMINSDNHFDQMYQEIRLLKKPVNVKPGDAILNTCVYDTRDRENMTLGGFSIREEMCVNYMHYYPASALEVCKSSIADHVIERFFSAMNGEMSKTLKLEDNFNAVQWNSFSKSLLSDLYDKAPISFSCNSSDGEHVHGVYSKQLIKGKYFKPIDVTNMPSEYAPEDPELTGQCYRKNFKD